MDLNIKENSPNNKKKVTSQYFLKSKFGPKKNMSSKIISDHEILNEKKGDSFEIDEDENAS
jgi:hypothetical protein